MLPVFTFHFPNEFECALSYIPFSTVIVVPKIYGPQLSAVFVDTFAFNTTKDRM